MRRALILPVLLAGCSMTPHYARPGLPVPATLPTGGPYAAQADAALPSVPYTQVFTDPRLQQVIARALANNRDLRAAVANIAAARAQYRIQRADLVPQVDATGSYSYADRGRSGTTTGSSSAASTASSAFQATVGTTAFELDLFGRVRALTGAALNRYFATEAGARATRLTLVGDVAEAWLQLAADRSRLRIAGETARVADASVRLTQARLQGGIAPRTDLAQAQQILATAQADMAEQQTQVAQDANALQLLVGAPVDPALLPADIEKAGPTIAALPAGVDSGVLLRRPDVIQAEYQLRAYNAEIGAARAALFPRLSLTGLLGFASTALRTLFTGGAFSYSVAPSVSYPIFTAGAGRAGVAYSQAQRDAAVATYEKAIQTAFQETADALARQGTIATQLAANQRFAAGAADTLTLVNARYQGGVDTFLANLDAQRSLYTARQTVIATQLVAATNRVALYRALGGDATLDAVPTRP